MLSTCAVCGSASSSRVLSLSRSSLATCKLPRNPRVLRLGFFFAEDASQAIASRAPQPPDTSKSRDVRAAAGVVRDYASPLPCTDGQHDGAAESAEDAPLGELVAGADVVSEEAVAEELRLGRSPVEVLESLRDGSSPAFWAVVDHLHAHGRTAEALEVFEWWKGQDEYRPCEQHYTKLIRMLGQARMPTDARALFVEMCDLSLRPSVATYTYLLQSYAERGLFDDAESILRDMVLSGDAKPNTVTYTGLIHAYGKHGRYDSMWRTFNRMKTHRVPADEVTYWTLIKAYAQGGLFRRMQQTVREMRRNGVYADAATMNAIVLAYAEAGLVKEMEKQYALLTQSSIPVRETTVKAMVGAYVKSSLFFQLNAFVKRVGLRRRAMGNTLWNALLLSRAGSFAVQELRVEFDNMQRAGFYPDVTTCNIMTLAYSRTKELSELHELVVSMQDNGVAPDLVTYGAVVDVFVEKEMRPKLLEALVEFRNLDVMAEVETDPLVFEVFGKGRFHAACETLARSTDGKGLDQRTYSELVGIFLQDLNKAKSSRRNSSP